MNEINARIQMIRQELGLSRRAFGEPLAASDSVIKNLENNLTEPKPAFIELICRTYNVNRTWLETGEGEMFNDLTRDAQIAEFIGETLADEDDTFKKRLISALSGMTVDEWEILEKLVTRLANSDENKKESE